MRKVFSFFGRQVGVGEVVGLGWEDSIKSIISLSQLSEEPKLIAIVFQTSQQAKPPNVFSRL